MQHLLPAVFIAFADDESQQLDALHRERKAIKTCLEQSPYSNWVQVEHESFTTTSDISERLETKLQGNLTIFHFAGHAAAQDIQLQDGQLGAEKLAAHLATAPFLKLVFLNACHSMQQAEVFFQAGIPALIVTTLPIGDELAADFATHFYQAFSRGDTIREAYTKACKKLKASPSGQLLQHTDTRIITRAGRKDQTESGTSLASSSWVLMVADEQEDVLEWRLGAMLLQETLSRGSYDELTRLQAAQWQFEKEHLLVQHIHSQDKLFYSDGGPHAFLSPELNMLLHTRFQQVPHIVLQGAGGMGKTIVLLKTWYLTLYQPRRFSAPVPIYLNLSAYKPTSNDEIIRMICRRYLNEEYPSTKALNELYQLLKRPLQTSPHFLPSVLLLLDGFNELRTEGNIRTRFLQELHYICEHYPGVHIVISTRDQVDTYPLLKGFQQMVLQPLDYPEIGRFLLNIDEANDTNLYDEWCELWDDDPLDDLLRHPLSLQLYGQTAQVLANFVEHSSFQFKANPTKLGELLWNQLQMEIVKIYVVNKADHERYEWQRFLLLDLLPSIGYVLAYYGTSSTLEVEEELNIMYLSFYNTRARYLKIYPSITTRFDATFPAQPDGHTQTIQPLLQILEKELGLLRFDQQTGGYYFEHEYFRDFYAAFGVLLNFEQTRYNDAEEERVPGFTGGPLPLAVNKLIGEIVGDYRNVMQLVNGQYESTVLDEALQQFGAEKFYGGQNFLVYNILEAWNEMRGHLAGADLRGLNLRSVTLGNKRLAIPQGATYLSARLDGANVSSHSIFDRGHRTGFKATSTNPLFSTHRRRIKVKHDGEFALTSSLHNDLKLWRFWGKQHLELQTFFYLQTFDFGFLHDSTHIWLITCYPQKGNFYQAQLVTFDPVTGATHHSPLVDDILNADVFLAKDEQTIVIRYNNSQLQLLSLPTLDSLGSFQAPTDVYFSQLELNKLTGDLMGWLNDGSFLVWRMADLSEVVRYRTDQSEYIAPLLLFSKFDGYRYWYVSQHLNMLKVFQREQETPLCWQFDSQTCNWNIIDLELPANMLQLHIAGSRVFYYLKEEAPELVTYTFYELATSLTYRQIEVPNLTSFNPVHYLWPEESRASRLIFAPSENHLQVYELAEDQLSALLPLTPDFQHFDFSPDGSSILAINQLGHVVECDLQTGQQLRSLLPGGGGIEASPVAYYFPDGQDIIVGAADGTLTWFVEKDEEKLLADGAGSAIQQLVYSLDGRFIYFTLGAGYLQVYDRHHQLIIHSNNLFTVEAPTYLGYYPYEDTWRVGMGGRYGVDIRWQFRSTFGINRGPDDTNVTTASAGPVHLPYRVFGNLFGGITIVNTQTDATEKVEINGKVISIQFSECNPNYFWVDVKAASRELLEWQHRIGTNRAFQNEHQQTPTLVGGYFIDIRQPQQPLLVLLRERLKGMFDRTTVLGHTSYAPQVDYVLMCEHFEDYEIQSQILGLNEQVIDVPTAIASLMIFSLDEATKAFKDNPASIPYKHIWTFYNTTISQTILAEDGETIFMSLNLPIYDAQTQQTNSILVLGELSTTDSHHVKLCRPAITLPAFAEGEITLSQPPNQEGKILGIQINRAGAWANWYGEFLINDQIILPIGQVLGSYPNRYLPPQQIDLPAATVLHTFYAYPGMQVWGCSFKNLSPESNLPKEDKDVLRTYGAIFDQRDQLRWDVYIKSLEEEE